METLVFFSVIIALVLQIYLSGISVFAVSVRIGKFKNAQKYAGLLLPCLSFIFSIIFCLWYTMNEMDNERYIVDTQEGTSYAFQTQKEANEFVSTLGNGELISSSRVLALDSSPSAYALGYVRTFLGANIYTVILLSIYFGFKRYGKRKIGEYVVT